MATSTEKVFQFLEQLQDLDDGDLRDVLRGLGIPASPTAARVGAAAFAKQVPYDYRELDKLINDAREFLYQLQSDELIGQAAPEASVP